MTGIFNKPIFRSNLKFKNVEQYTDNKSKISKKSQVLNNLIYSIKNSTCKIEDYVKYLVHLNIGNGWTDNLSNLSLEQKEYLTYLCGNERKYFGAQKVTRGQIKIWFILYQLENKLQFPDFKTLTKWIEFQVNREKFPLMDSSGYLKEINDKCKKYYESISISSDNIIKLGEKGYRDASYNLFELNNKMKPLQIEGIEFEPGQTDTLIDIFHNIGSYINNNENRFSDDSEISLNYSNPSTPSTKHSDYYGENQGFFLNDSEDSDGYESPLTPRQKELLLKNVPPMQRNSFLFKERRYVSKHMNFNNFYLQNESIKIIRNYLADSLNNLAIVNEYYSDKILFGEYIIYFVMDTLTQIRNILKSHHPEYLKEIMRRKYAHTSELLLYFPSSEIFLDETMVEFFLDNFLSCICTGEILKVSKILIGKCFEYGYLDVNLDFEFVLPKFEFFEINREELHEKVQKQEIDKINNLINFYSDYCRIPGAFGGNIELTLLGNIPVFRDYGHTIVSKVRKEYDTLKAHIGGNKIASDGNCLITKFIFEYLIHEEQEKFKLYE